MELKHKQQTEPSSIIHFTQNFFHFSFREKAILTQLSRILGLIVHMKLKGLRNAGNGFPSFVEN